MLFIVKSPLSVPVSKKKSLSLNLNVYRNAYYQTLNKAKRVYETTLYEQLRELPFLAHIDSITYTLYPKTSRRCDVSNICSIVDKFFSDTLVKYGYIEDDDYKHISSIIYQYGCIDKEEPRVEIAIDGKARNII